MLRFTMRDVVWLTVVVGLATIVVRDRWAASATPLALEGYCPVTLVRARQWQRGDPLCRTIYEGRKHLFASQAEQEMFLGTPSRFVPACGGNDPVRLAEEMRESPGFRCFGLTYNSRIYLFDSDQSLQKFAANPAAYVQR